MGTPDRDSSWRERPAAAAYASHLLFGIVMALLGAILPTLSERIGFDLAQAGRLFVVMNACLLASCLGLGPLMDRFGMKPPLVMGSLLAGTGLALVALAHDYQTLAWGTAVLGLGGGALNAGGNTLVADLHQAQEARSAALNRLGVFFGIGAVLMPLAIGLLLQTAELASILLAGAALCVAVALHNALVSLPPPKRHRHVPLADVVSLAREPLVLVFAALLFFQSGNEFVAGGYASSFLVRESGLSVRAASWALTGFWSALTLARLALSSVALRVNGPRLLVLCALASAAGTALLVFSRHPAVAVLALSWMGASLAGIFPTALGIVGARYPGFTGTVFGLLLTAALTGGMLLPWLSGLIGEAHGLRPAMALVAAQCLAIAALAAHAGRRHSDLGNGGGPSGM
jgi:FHS family glucose/mannose:H+ symporter-like MFS transporter